MQGCPVQKQHGIYFQFSGGLPKDGIFQPGVDLGYICCISPEAHFVKQAGPESNHAAQLQSSQYDTVLKCEQATASLQAVRLRNYVKIRIWVPSVAL